MTLLTVVPFALLLLFSLAVAWRMHRRRHSLPSAYRKVRGSPFVVYVLRDGKGIPLYLGYSHEYDVRLRRHLNRPEEWGRRIDPVNCCKVRWAKDRKQGLRIERRRIRSATVLARWRLIPVLHNDADIHSQRVWFPRLWALIYLVEGWLCEPCRLTAPVLGELPAAMPRPLPDQSPVASAAEAVGESVEADREVIAEESDSAPGVEPGNGCSLAADDPPYPAHPSGDPGSARSAPMNADADSVHVPPTGVLSAVADADTAQSVQSASPLGDLEAFVAARNTVQGSPRPEETHASPTGAPDRPSASKRGTGTAPKSGARTAYNREQKRRARAKAKATS